MARKSINGYRRISWLSNHDTREQAEAECERMRLHLRRHGKASAYGVLVEHVSGAWHVTLWERND